MKQSLYYHWADSTLLLAIALIIVLGSFYTATPYYLFLVWLQFPVYLLHQFEEHVFPGKFKEFINQKIFKSAVNDFPLSQPAVFWINILAIWILFPLGAVLAQNLSPRFGVLLPIFGLFNATLHILFFVVKRGYNPGLLVSVLLNYPSGIYTLQVLNQAGLVDKENITYALLLTIVSHGIIVLFVAKEKLTRARKL